MGKVLNMSYKYSVGEHVLFAGQLPSVVQEWAGHRDDGMPCYLISNHGSGDATSVHGTKVSEEQLSPNPAT